MAEGLGFSHATAFNLRHKLLSALEIHEENVPTVLEGVCEVDDTYVLESVKGTKSRKIITGNRANMGQRPLGAEFRGSKSA